MRSPVPPLIDLEAFEAAARHSSFAAAAAELHLSPSAVSHRVRQLERQLGVVLFVRHARRVELTDHARAYLPSVRKAFDELAMSTAGLFGPVTPSQRLTVRAPISYAVAVIAPSLHHFTEAHPTVDVRLVSALWADTAVSDDVDVDIRFGLGSWPGRHAELLHDDRAIVVCTQPFAAEYDLEHDPSRLGEVPRVHVLGLEQLWAEVLGADTAGPRHRDATVDTSLAALALARSGRFAALLPERFVPSDTAHPTLRSIGQPVAMRQAHYVVSAHRSRPSTMAALHFTDWLRRLTAGTTTAAPPTTAAGGTRSGAGHTHAV